MVKQNLILLVALTGTLTVAGCDHYPAESSPASGGARWTSMPAHWKTYWRTPDELGVYDARFEFGINAQQIASTANGQAEMAAIDAIHARMVRVPFYWDKIAKEGWGELDDRIAVMLNRSPQLIPVFVVEKNPPRLDLTTCDAARRAQFINELRDVVAAGAQRYPGVRFWQIGNEMDAGGWPGAMGCNSASKFSQGQEFAKLLQALYPAVRQTSGAWVIIGALTGTENWNRQYGDWPTGTSARLTDNGSWNYLHGIYSAGGHRYFDIMSFHSYGRTAYGSVDYDINGLRSVMSAYGDQDRPIWLTEFGHNAWDYLYDGQRHISVDWPHRRGLSERTEYDSSHLTWWIQALAIQRSMGVVKGFGYRMESTDAHGSPTSLKPDRYDFMDREEFRHMGDSTRLPRLPRGGERIGYGFGLLRYEPAQLALPHDDRGYPREMRPTYTYLRDNNQNASLAPATANGDVRVYAPGRDPVLAAPAYYTRDGDYVTIHNLQVGNLGPTLVPFTPAPKQLVYRLFRSNLPDYLYSLSSTEGTAQGWVLENMRWRTSTSPTGLSDLRRCFNGSRHWAAIVPANGANACGDSGVYESSLGFALSPTAIPDAGMVPLYMAQRNTTREYLLTTSTSEYNSLAGQGFTLQGVIAYVWPE